MNPETVVELFDQLKSERGTWEDTWQDVADYCRPIRHCIDTRDTPGSRRMTEITDNTGNQALDRFASGLYGYMCRPDEQWFKLQSVIPAVMENEDATRWFNTVSQLMRRNIYSSRFAQEITEDFLDLGSIGTSNLYIEAGEEYPLRFKNIDINKYVCEENASGEIDRVVRKMNMKSRMAVEVFGEENLPDNIVADYKKEKETNKKWTFYHYVGKRIDGKPNAVTPDNMMYESLYVEKDSKKIVKEGGYRTMPYVVARFMKDPDETYGRSPAINCIADIKMLNSMTQTMLKSAEKRVAPPMAVAYGTIMNTPKFTSNSITYIRGNVGQDMPRPIDTGGDVGLGVEVIKMYQNSVKEGFYTDMFDYLVGGQYMTATEVESRKQNKLFLLAPMLSRVQSEKLNKMLVRVYDILSEAGLFPDIPQIILENPKYEIQFNGKMALALQSIETGATQLTLGMIQPLAQYDPTILDNFDWNAIARGTAMSNGMPAVFVKSKAQVTAERQAQAESMRQQQEMMMLQQGASAVKDLSNPVQQGSPAEAIMEAQGGQ